MAPNHVTLDDKYDLTKSHVFVTGYQAIIRSCLMQKERDRRAGLNTAGYVTGYRGSPLGGLDQQFMRAAKVLAPNDVIFQAGINEDLAATALWGSQQAELRGEGKYDGVFGIWYGKGPGRRPHRRRVPPRQFRRHVETRRRPRADGRRPHGGILDHRAPVGIPLRRRDDADPQSGRACRRSSTTGSTAGRCRASPAPGSASSACTRRWNRPPSIDGSMDRVKIVTPDDFEMPEGGLNIRLVDTFLGQEARLHDYKRDAMLAFIRANKLNKYITSGGRTPKIGIITTGKSYLDVRQAFDELGIDEVKANDLGIRLYKVACPWPMSRQELQEFAAGLDLIIVVEEKRSLIEVQVREELYGTPNQPVCIGKKDEPGNWLFPVKGALDPNDVAICIGERLLKYGPNEAIAGHVARLKTAQRDAGRNHRRRDAHAVFLLGLPAQHLDRRAAKACAPMPASAATSWRSGWTARRSAAPIWAARAPTGSARRRSRSGRTCSRISATAPTTTPATWRSAPRRRRASTSPTRSSTTTRSR